MQRYPSSSIDFLFSAGIDLLKVNKKQVWMDI